MIDYQFESTEGQLTIIGIEFPAGCAGEAGR
jgi:hypothetical protein